MPTLTKLIRTIIGLPVVLTLWPFAIAIGFIVFCGKAVNEVFRWIIYGEFQAWDFATREQEKKELLWATRIIVLPYVFVRYVWKN